MAIICVTREIGALGEEIAEEISSMAGLRVVDKERVEGELAKRGLALDKLMKFDEKRPGFWASLSPARDEYLHFLRTVVLDEAAADGAVFMGRGAGSILRSVPGVVSVKFVAPRPERVRRIAESLNITERQAEQLVQRTDADRAGYHSFFFGMDWKLPDSYDMVLNTAGLDPVEAARIVIELSMQRVAKADAAAAARGIADLRLAQAVVTEILYARKVPVQFLEAEAKGGAVALHGVVSSRPVIELALAAARSVKGVDSVTSEIQVVQEYAAIP